jgi:hypothetical protein
MEEEKRGWIGTLGQLKSVLRTFKGDTDEEGAYLVRGGITTFMGQTGDDAECVVSGGAEFRCGGKWFNVATALRQTSYGVGIMVL